MKKFDAPDLIALAILITGGLNLGLTGINKNWDIIHIFSNNPSLGRILYIIIGLSSLWAIYAVSRIITSE